MDATILGLSFSRDVIFYERLQGDATTAQRLGQRLVKGMPILEDYFKSVFIRKNDRTYYNKNVKRIILER